MKTAGMLILAAGLGWSVTSRAQDTAKAEAALRSSGCPNCHSVSAEKYGPSYKSLAAKYKGRADAAARIEGELRSGAMKVDGEAVKHAALKGSDADVKNVVAYILSR